MMMEDGEIFPVLRFEQQLLEKTSAKLEGAPKPDLQGQDQVPGIFCSSWRHALLPQVTSLGN